MAWYTPGKKYTAPAAMCSCCIKCVDGQGIGERINLNTIGRVCQLCENRAAAGDVIKQTPKPKAVGIALALAKYTNADFDVSSGVQPLNAPMTDVTNRAAQNKNHTV